MKTFINNRVHGGGEGGGGGEHEAMKNVCMTRGQSANLLCVLVDARYVIAIGTSASHEIYRNLRRREEKK